MVLFLGIYVLFGVLVALTHALNWRHRPRFRHFLFWPLVHGCMLFGNPLPPWLDRPPRR